MADDDIQGQVVDQDGNTVANAVVALWKQDAPNQVITTQADSSGNYIFDSHPDGDGTSQNWHLAAYDPNDGSRQFPSLHSVSSQLDIGIPDSGLLHNYDWSDESTTTSTVPDLAGTDDLTGSFTDLNGSINGVTAGSFDGLDDSVDGQFSSTIAEPIEVFVVSRSNDTGSANQTVYDGFSNATFAGRRWQDDAYQLFFGGSSLVQGTLTTNNEIWMTRHDSPDLIEINGTQVLSGSSGDGPLDGLSVGTNREGNFPLDGVMGQILVYDPSASGYSRSGVYDYLSDKWGITI